MNQRRRAEDLFSEFTANGIDAIDRFVSEQRSEELFVDYKRSADNGGGSKLHATDRQHLAKALSGFGNSEGGLIVWGVTCQHNDQLGDIPTGKVPLLNPKRFVSWLEGAVSGCTLPPISGARHLPIQVAGQDNGYVVTYVPKSMRAPHQCIVEPYRYRYYLRAGSNFEQVPHGVLAGMFGQRPTPSIFYWGGLGGSVTDDGASRVNTLPKSTPYVWLTITLVNDGVVMARDLFVNILISGPGQKSMWAMDRPKAGWDALESLRGLHSVSQDSFKLAPGASVSGLSIRLYLTPPFDSDLRYEISLGCSGTPVERIERTVPTAQIDAAYTDFIKNRNGEELARQVFGLSEGHIIEPLGKLADEQSSRYTLRAT